MNEELKNKIINAAYGDGSFMDKIKVQLLIRKNEFARNLFYEYKSTSSAVKSLKKEKLPREIFESVIRKTEMKLDKNSIFTDFYTLVLSKPIVSATATIILIAVIITSSFLKNYNDVNQYSQAEIQLANKQAKETFALIGKIFNSTTKTLKQDIINDRVRKPIKQGLNVVNDLFSEGNKNEKIN